VKYFIVHLHFSAREPVREVYFAFIINPNFPVVLLHY